MSIFSFFRRKNSTEEQTELSVQPVLEPTRRIDLKAIQEELAQHSATGAGKRKQHATAAAQANNNVAAGEPEFPVGWLAVVAGPGRGRALSLQAGINAIGRGPRAHVRLDFGDTAIAESDHAILNYSAAQQEFHLLPGQGSSAALLLNETVVKDTVTLQGGELLTLGNTQLRFVPLCGKDFDW